MIRTVYTYMALLRVDNYIKNLFIFAPLFFGFQFDISIILCAVLSFLLFCLLASSMYIFNDIFDIESDRLHPVKKIRPLASGTVTIKNAISIALLLVSISLFGAYLIDISVVCVFVTYLFINVLYNLYLKKIPIIDVIIISFGFVIRIIVGSYATNINASTWILSMTFLLALFLGFSKRRADMVLVDSRVEKSSNIRLFTISSIDKTIYILAFIISITYILYTLSKEVVDRVGSSFVFLTSFWVITGITRYIHTTKSSIIYKDPTAVVIQDWLLQSIILLWVSSFIILKYL
ncbi:UbiA prenyltransferase family protein [Aquimarina sp. M1]